MNEYNDEKIIREIKAGLDEIEEKINVNTPDIARFRKMISHVEINKAKKVKREALLFMIIAIIALSIEIYAFNQSILFFMVLQGFASTSFLIGLLNWLIKANRKVKPI